ncbi:hypothetical protein K2173_005351 [Erythroxylum novogranatense]|uniref:RING-type domain-containing protein n=1 Tax=Erythroxylum novogranatense TaxID=1862640 RepID=A0AAV8TT93_9ROSI|nr:hypothetical protein K2173_005351 [Erythroxylum novogranatense]
MGDVTWHIIFLPSLQVSDVDDEASLQQLGSVVLFLLQRMDCSSMCLLPRLNLRHILVYEAYNDGRSRLSTHGRKATIRDFYKDVKEGYYGLEKFGKRGLEGDIRFSNVDLERENECGICLEPCTKIVLPNCCHAMCIKCYRNYISSFFPLSFVVQVLACHLCGLCYTEQGCRQSYKCFCFLSNYRNTKSESCPFCRGSLKRVNSEDLWVLTCDNDVVDTKTISKDYLDTLPKDYPDALFLVYYEYLF